MIHIRYFLKAPIALNANCYCCTQHYTQKHPLSRMACSAFSRGRSFLRGPSWACAKRFTNSRNVNRLYYLLRSCAHWAYNFLRYHCALCQISIIFLSDIMYIMLSVSTCIHKETSLYKLLVLTADKKKHTTRLIGNSCNINTQYVNLQWQFVGWITKFKLKRIILQLLKVPQWLTGKLYLKFCKFKLPPTCQGFWNNSIQPSNKTNIEIK